MSDRDKSLKHAVDDAVRRLSSAEHFMGASLVSMPVLYPSGANVVLEVSNHSGRFFVSDRAGGYMEADLMGVTSGYTKDAERVAQDAGIRFDGRNMFVVEAPIDVMPAILKIVAHCSQLAANMSASRVHDKVTADLGLALFERLVSAFNPKRVAKDADIIGPSNHLWRVSALVTGGAREIAFDAVGGHPTAAVWTAAKFGDLGQAENPPRRVAAIGSFKRIGNMLGVVTQQSDAVVEITASNDEFQMLDVA